MNKLFRFAFLAAFAVLFMTSCNKKPKITGTWMEKQSVASAVADTSSVSITDSSLEINNDMSNEWGFTLLDDGSVLPINMGYREYHSWERKDETLILKLSYKGSNPHEDADTMKIVKLVQEELILEDGGGNQLAFIRKGTE